jgi:LPS sulfotransferase NodH
MSNSLNVSPQVGIAICTTARSGSNLLSDAMTATGLLGAPKEYFNYRGRRRYGEADYPDDPRKQIELVLRHATSPNGTYAIKTFFWQSEKTIRRVDWTRELPNLHYIFLTRSDLLGQAISLAISRQTGQFRSTDPSSIEPVFDAQSIRRCIRELAAENAKWEEFFAQRGILPLRLRYEEIVQRLSETVVSIGEFARISVSPDPHWQSRLQVQRKDINSNWRGRYLQWEAEPLPFWGRLFT